MLWLCRHCFEADMILRLGWNQIVSLAAVCLSLQGKGHRHGVSFGSLSPFSQFPPSFSPSGFVAALRCPWLYGNRNKCMSWLSLRWRPLLRWCTGRPMWDGHIQSDVTFFRWGCRLCSSTNAFLEVVSTCKCPLFQDDKDLQPVHSSHWSEGSKNFIYFCVTIISFKMMIVKSDVLKCLFFEL